MKFVLVFPILSLLVNGSSFCHQKKDGSEVGLSFASKLLHTGVNPSVQPCPGFYKFACGSFAENANISGTVQVWHFTRLEMLFEAIKCKSTENVSHIPQYARKVVDFYEMCMTNVSSIGEEQVRTAVLTHLKNDPELQECLIRPCNNNTYKLLGRLHRIFGTHGLFNLDFYDTGFRLLFEISTPNSIFLNSFFGNNSQMPKISADEDLRSFHKLSAEIDKVNWLEFFRNLLTKEQLSRWNPETAKFKVIPGDYSYLTNLINDSTLAAEFFVRHVVYENFQRQARERHSETCLQLILEKMASAAYRLIFDFFEWNVEEWIHDLNHMFENVRSAFTIFISNADWITGPEKARVLNKSRSLRFYTGIPNWLSNNNEVDRRTPFSLNASAKCSSYIENILQMDKEIFNYKIDNLNDNFTFFDLAPDFIVNAFYSEPSNYMRLSGGLPIPPAYHSDYPLSIKYGLIGSIIGHEFMHAFNPSLVGGMLGRSNRQFLNRQKCIQKQLFSYCHHQKGICLSGKTHLDEVMSDIDGLKIAYMAMKFASATTADEIPVPGFASLTHEQAFFTAYAQFFCQNNQSLNEAIDHSDKDGHPPKKARVDLAVGSFPQFAKAFGCQTGSYHSPTKICPLWGSYHGNSMLGHFK